MKVFLTAFSIIVSLLTVPADLPDPESVITVSEAEQHLLERVVMSEAGGQSAYCQEAVATVILNRVYCEDKFPDNITDVIYAPGQFSTHNNGDPTDQVKLSVALAIDRYQTEHQCINKSCYYFRSGNYHNFGIDYMHIGDLYFSLAENFAE